MLLKNDFINRLTKRGYTKKDASIIIDDVTNEIMNILAEGESLRLHGFGTFETREYAARETTDFQTKEKIEIPAHKAPRFIAGNSFKRSVREQFVRE